MTTATTETEGRDLVGEAAAGHAALLRQMREFDTRYKVLCAGKEKMSKQRAELVIAARSLDPQMTYKEIADLWGVSQAAIMQLEYRELVDRGLKPKRPRNPPKAKKAE